MSTEDSAHQVHDIKIADIRIKKGRRSLSSEKINELMESISRLGLQTPIVVRRGKVKGKELLFLVTGLHRLEAMTNLGRETISCTIMEGDARQARLWEIAENLHRAELTPLEYDEHVAEWVRLIEEGEDDEENDGEEANGPDEQEGLSGQNVRKTQWGRPEGGKAKAARNLPVKGKSDEAKRKNVERAIKVASISAAAKEEAKKTGLDQEHTALLKIAAEKTPAAQLTKVRELAARKADKKKHGSSGWGQVKAQKADSLSAAEKKTLQGLLKSWEKYVLAAFAKAPPAVRREFLKKIQRAPSAATKRTGWGKR